VQYKKIAILGITGAGKSTLSRRLAAKTGLPLFHMDSLFWKGNWEEVPEEEYLRKHADILATNDSWIIEGWINPKMAERLAQADLVIYLDYPGVRAALRYVDRWLKHRKVARPELPEESRERFKWRRLFLLLSRGERPDIEDSLSFAGDMKKIVRLLSPSETERFLNERFP